MKHFRLNCVSVGFCQKDMKRVLCRDWVLPEGYDTCPVFQWRSVRSRISPLGNSFHFITSCVCVFVCVCVCVCVRVIALVSYN